MKFDCLTDEALILLNRFEVDKMARDVLAVRYFKLKESMIHWTGCYFVRYLDNWTKNEVYFHSFLLAESEFEFGRGTFRALLSKILKREITREYLRTITERVLIPTVSLDEELPAGGTLHDVLSGEAENKDTEQAEYVNIMDIRDAIKRAPHMSKHTKRIVSLVLKGYSTSEAAHALGISASFARRCMVEIREFLLNKGFVDSILDEIADSDETPSDETEAAESTDVSE